MKRVIRYFGWALLVARRARLVAAGAAHLLAQRKLNRAIDVNVAPVAFVSDDASHARGKYLFESRGCGECHGDNGAGKLLIDDPGGLRVWTPNITAGPGSAVAKYTEADWVRTIRHGVKPDKRPILIMPCEDYNRFTDADVAAIVAYVRSLPAVQGEIGRIEMPLIMQALYAADVVPDAPQRIDHTLPPAQAVAEGPTPEHGAYVANMCKGCHGEAFHGGKIPGSPPDWPPGTRPHVAGDLRRLRQRRPVQGDAEEREATQRRGDQGDAVPVARGAERHRRRGALRLPEDAAEGRRPAVTPPARGAARRPPRPGARPGDLKSGRCRSEFGRHEPLAAWRAGPIQRGGHSMFASMTYPSAFGDFDRLRRELDDLFGLAGLPTSIRSAAPGAFPALNIGTRRPAWRSTPSPRASTRPRST